MSRKLYDRAVGTAMSHSIAKLAPGAGAHLHPLDVDALGVDTGDDVQLIGEKATAVLPVVANPAVPRGIVWAPFNQGGAVEDLIDGDAAVIDVKIEVVVMGVLAIDPLGTGGLLWTSLIIMIVKVLIIFGVASSPRC